MCLGEQKRNTACKTWIVRIWLLRTGNVNLTELTTTYPEWNFCITKTSAPLNIWTGETFKSRVVQQWCTYSKEETMACFVTLLDLIGAPDWKSLNDKRACSRYLECKASLPCSQGLPRSRSARNFGAAVLEQAVWARLQLHQLLHPSNCSVPSMRTPRWSGSRQARIRHQRPREQRRQSSWFLNAWVNKREILNGKSE